MLSLLKQKAPEGMGATEIARRTGIDRGTVHRLLLALEAGGWARKGVAGRRHFVDIDGEVSGAIGSIEVGLSRELILRALPAMRKLARELGDAVFLVVRDGSESVGIHREIGDYPVQILATYPGKRHPLGVGSAGMALLATLPEADAVSIVEANAARLEEYGGIMPEMIHRLRINTQQRGYAVMKNYAVSGALGVGCAMTRDDGTPVLAISVSAVIERMPLKRQALIAGLIRQELDGLRFSQHI